MGVTGVGGSSSRCSDYGAETLIFGSLKRE